MRRERGSSSSWARGRHTLYIAMTNSATMFTGKYCKEGKFPVEVFETQPWDSSASPNPGRDKIHSRSAVNTKAVHDTLIADKSEANTLEESVATVRLATAGAPPVRFPGAGVGRHDVVLAGASGRVRRRGLFALCGRGLQKVSAGKPEKATPLLRDSLHARGLSEMWGQNSLPLDKMQAISVLED